MHCVEHLGIPWNILEHSGMLWKHLEQSRTFWKFLEGGSGRFWNMSLEGSIVGSMKGLEDSIPTTGRYMQLHEHVVKLSDYVAIDLLNCTTLYL